MPGVLSHLAEMLIGHSLPFRAAKSVLNTTTKGTPRRGALSNILAPDEKLLLHGSMQPIHKLRDNDAMFLSDIFKLSSQFTNSKGYVTPFAVPRKMITPLTYEDAYDKYWAKGLDMPKGVFKGYSEFDEENVPHDFPFKYEDLLKHEFYANPQSLLTPLSTRFDHGGQVR